MAIYDVYLNKLAEYVDEMRRKGRQTRVMHCPSDTGELLEGLPVKVGPGSNSGIILRSDSFMEMGNPEAGSSAFLLWTDSPSLIRDGRITLIGPDIPESPGASLPFGQVLLVGGEELGEGDHQKLEHIQFVADQIEGYMIRSVSQLIWSRVSNEAVEKGFRFESLGRALMAIFKSEMPQVQSMEIIFVTSDREDLLPLDDIGAQVKKIYRSLLTANWKAKGFDIYECIYGGDCQTCPDQPVCDDIREVIKVRKQKNGGSETSS
jgi:CO dehydrogenase/acetyl-CoA synthase beta subunit